MSASSFFSDLSRRLAPVLPAPMRRAGAVVPVVRLQGTIGVGVSLRPALTLASVAPLLERAFAVRDAAEVALIVNSPGGSPVQSHLIFQRIRQLADEKGLGVTAFVEDAAASGGYMLACAGDTIVIDPSSIVGSIGVISAGFGFDRLIERVGIERRIHAAGERKAMLDPFVPERPEDVRRLEAAQKEVHGVFSALVRARRGDRLQGTDKVLFSGDFWVGEQALDLGIADAIGDVRSTMRARYGDKVELRPIGGRRPLLLRGMFGTGAPDAAADTILTALEARALWARLGL